MSYTDGHRVNEPKRRRSSADTIEEIKYQQDVFLRKVESLIESISSSAATHALKVLEGVTDEQIALLQKAYLDRLIELPETIDHLVTLAVQNQVPIKHEIIITNGTQSQVLPNYSHYKLGLLIHLLSLRLHVMLVGQAGSGKSTGAFQAAEIMSLDYYERSMGPGTSQWDLLGYLSPDGEYVPGVLRKPYECGGLLMLDELDNSNPSVLTTLNSAIANGHCSFPDQMVMRHPDFVLIGAGNTYGRGSDRMYVGRQQLDAATLDRFAVIDWDYDESAEFEWAGQDMQQWTQYIQKVRHIVQKHLMRVIVSPRASINGAKMLRAGIDRATVEDMVLWKGISSDDKARIVQELRS